MTHPIFRKEIFIETAFERRFQAMLRSAWQKRSWHVLVADPGSGKTMGIVDFVRTTGSPSGTLSGRSYPTLAVTAPKNDESEQALGNQLFTALGLPLRGRWSERKPKLMGNLVQFGTQCLIVDDAHDLSLEHLMFLPEGTDGPGAFTVPSSAWVVPGHGWARQHDATERDTRSARDDVAPVSPPPR